MGNHTQVSSPGSRMAMGERGRYQREKLAWTPGLPVDWRDEASDMHSSHRTMDTFRVAH